MDPTPPAPDPPTVSKDPRDQVLTDTVGTWRAKYPGNWGLLLAIMLIVDAESDWRVLSNGGGDPRLNQAQRDALVGPSRAIRKAKGYPASWEGNNGVSVGPTQASPREATTLRTRADGTPWPWDGWGTIAQCMDTKWIVAKTLDQLQQVPATGGTVAWCWRVQRWSVDADPDTNYTLFGAAPETLNYARRVTRVTAMMDNYSPSFFADGGS